MNKITLNEELWIKCHRGLINGEYDEWWPRHEWIRTGSSASKDEYQLTPTYGKPIWKGDRERTVLVNADFGMGDTIHFYRFIPEAQKKVSRLILRCDEDFKTLFTDVEVIGKDEPLPCFDEIIHMMALPFVLGITKKDISGKPYLNQNNVYPIESCGVFDMLSMRSTKIGICWKGNPHNPRDSARSLPESAKDRFVCGFNCNVYFFNVNKIHENSDRVINLGNHFADWNQTAYFLRKLDVLITVDTAVAHLAGSMGVPVWLLLNNNDPDWRWGRQGERTIWYDSMRIFRRESTWEDLVDCVVAAVKEPKPFF